MNVMETVKAMRNRVATVRSGGIMEQYSFDEFGQTVPCPDREKCGAYLLSPLPDGTPRGCTGQRKWCKTNFEKERKLDEQ